MTRAMRIGVGFVTLVLAASSVDAAPRYYLIPTTNAGPGLASAHPKYLREAGH